MENKKVEFKDTGLPDIIELRNINQTYDNGHIVINDLDLLIEDKPNQGQFVVLLGRSGCGKSTLLRYIAGLQEPTKGIIKINTVEIEKADLSSVGMVFQKYSSFPWLTVLENVALPLQLKGVNKKERELKAKEMIKLVGLEGHEDKFAVYPTLSGGQLQRIAIARSLIQNPKILLMDEPFGALDIRTRMEMQDLLIEIWNKYKLTIVLVTHDINEAVYLSDEVIIMSPESKGIVYHKENPLPLERNQSIRKTLQFRKFVEELETALIEL